MNRISRPVRLSRAGMEKVKGGPSPFARCPGPGKTDPSSRRAPRAEGNS